MGVVERVETGALVSGEDKIKKSPAEKGHLIHVSVLRGRGKKKPRTTSEKGAL